MDYNPQKREIGIFIEDGGIGIGWGLHHEDRRWENEIKLFRRRDFFSDGHILSGIKKLVMPVAYSTWKSKEIAHETVYGWGLLGVYVDIPSLKTKCSLLSQ